MVFVPDGRIRLKADVLPVLLLFIDLPVFAAAAGDEEKLKLPVASAPLFFPSLWFQWLPWLRGELRQRVQVVEPGGKTVEETCGCLRPSVSGLHRPCQQWSADAVAAFTVGDITAGHHVQGKERLHGCVGNFFKKVKRESVWCLKDKINKIT